VTIPANTLKVIKGGGDPGTYKAIDGANLINCRGLAPIPNKQITLSNGVLKQNTGWGDAQ
jgi:starch-binding outer membrane protein, SusD/RagB family